ncbi:MAG: hypothetical protein EBY32_04385, partial [Proteobacteria bacterium]|nr:hypothetical protein [Pseudomonadota bacterium]
MKLLSTAIRPRSAGRLQKFSACNLALDKCSLLVKILAAAMAVFVLAPSSVFAQSGTWLNTGSTSANWSETTNWASGTVPGATSGTTNSNNATFNTAVGTYGTSGSPILIDSGRNIRGIFFDTNSGSYTIGTTGGNALTMSNQAAITANSTLAGTGLNLTINAPLRLIGSGGVPLTISNNAGNANATMFVGGDISLSASGANNNFTLGGSNTNDNTVSGLISNGAGTLSISKSGAGIWLLNNNSNSFTGNISVGAGTLKVTSIGNQSVVSAAGAGSSILLGANNSGAALTYTGTGDTTNRTFRFLNTAGGTVTITQSGTGLLKLTGTMDMSGNTASKAIALGGSTAGTGEISGVIADNGASGTTGLAAAFSAGASTITVGSSDGVVVGATISGTGIAGGTTVTAISGKTLTLSANTNGAGTVGQTLTIAGVTNITSITKSGTGTWTLSGNNTYSGATAVSQGVLNIQHANALGNTSSGTTVSSGAALQLQGGITVGAETLSLTGNGVSTDGALRNISDSNTYGGAITLAGATRINSDAGLLTLSGGISGTQNLTIGGAGNTTISSAIATSTGTLTKDGAGTLILSANNTYTGNTTVSLGVINIQHAN